MPIADESAGFETKAITYDTEIAALSFDRFVERTAAMAAETESEGTDADLFHVSVMSALGDMYMMAVFQLKSEAYAFAQLAFDEKLPLLASTGSWVQNLDANGVDLYRRLSAEYRSAVTYLAKVFEGHGCLVHLDMAVPQTNSAEGGRMSVQ